MCVSLPSHRIKVPRPFRESLNESWSPREPAQCTPQDLDANRTMNGGRLFLAYVGRPYAERMSSGKSCSRYQESSRTSLTREWFPLAFFPSLTSSLPRLFLFLLGGCMYMQCIRSPSIRFGMRARQFLYLKVKEATA